MLCAGILIALLLAADGGVPSLEVAQTAFMNAHLDKSRLSQSIGELHDEFTRLDALWEDLAAKARPPDAITALVRQGELRWHLAAEDASAPAPRAIARLGEEAVATSVDGVAENVAALRREAKVCWARASALASKHHVSSPALENVRALMKRIRAAL